MKRLLLLVLVCACAAVSMGGCALISYGVPEEEVREINDDWYEFYGQDRRPTPEEIEEYNALDDEGKAQWVLDGKPVLEPLMPEFADAAKDYHESTEIELDLSEGTGGEEEQE